MTATRIRSEADLPPITLSRPVYERLHALAEAAERRLPEVSDYLFRELERAKVVEEARLPDSVVTIGSRVTFLDLDTNQLHDVTLVWPSDEDAALHRLSVTTPVGAALIGLTAGQQIAWRNRTGLWRHLWVEKVEN
ncbi:nucleoside diphosphate kinase regulator [Telmatospirillum sp. J64-1]|uniref:nucleoside diphosphate kinase regulator n=1 Tax=Telmatospirillum sp. J64-1 TaxID=2502183 RepID=UPI00115EFD18|nr:nucleoside diphosphate kinase regulator [Telmatospirillum sp. J64-1]